MRRCRRCPRVRSPDGHHDPGCAMVGALAAVFRNPPAELRELQYQRVVEEALVLKIGVESQKAVAERAHEIRIRPTAGDTLASVRIETTGFAPRILSSRFRGPSRQPPCAGPTRIRCSDR